MSRMIRGWARVLGLVAALLAGERTAAAQMAWQSWGVLPFSAVDIAVVEAGGRYVMYFTKYAGDPRPGRAFSSDLRTWTVDDRDFCLTSGDLCSPDALSALGHRPIIRLNDGRFRLFRKFGDQVQSFVSTDAITWTRDPGSRLTRDSSLVWERGARFITGLALLRLPDGRIRLYYSGVVVPGSEGTPPEYTNCGGCMGILSAISNDDGLTFVREPGVRVDPKVLGPSTSQGSFHAIGHSILPLDDGGYRLYTTSWSDGAVTYFSPDGLTFSLEGQIPAIGSDIATRRLDDGRVWLVSSVPGTVRHAEGCPQGCDNSAADLMYEVSHVMVYGPASFNVASVLWNRAERAATLTVEGAFTEPVTLNPIQARSACATTPDHPWCPWHPEYYAVTPATPGNPSIRIAYTGPSQRPDFTRDQQMYFEAVSGDQKIVTQVSCMISLASGTTPFCTN